MISLALTHYNRFNFLLEAVQHVQDHPAISEIVISDDASTDGSWEKLLHHFKDHPKVKLFRNEKNLDCYANKAKAVERVTGDWTILFDSDNVLPLVYLESLLRIPTWCSNTAYLPVFASPHFDYRAFSGLIITRQNVAQYMRQHGFSTALNTANYFFRRDEYLQVWDGSVNPHTADSIYLNYCWLKAGNALVFVKDLTYFHRVHPQSHYKLNCRKTGNFAREVEVKLRSMR